MREKFVGGLLLPGDETGDCFKFTQALAKLDEGLGVTFRQGVTIEQLVTTGDKVTGVDTSAGTFTADSFVVALGSFSPLLLKQIGIRIPVYPVKGYSITVPITDATGAPESTIMTKRTRWRSRAWATASASAAPPKSPATTCACIKRGATRWSTR